MSFPSGLGVYDLHDSRRGAVKINAGGKELNLSPGMGAIVTNADVPGFENVNPAQLFGYRSIKTRDLGDNLKAFTAEFSLTQAIQCVQPLRQLVCAKQPTAQLVTNRLLKTTAIISALSAGGPQYQQILHTTQVDRIAATH